LEINSFCEFVGEIRYLNALNIPKIINAKTMPIYTKQTYCQII